MVIGDQVGTDGILARRLDYALVLYDPRVLGAPAGPRLMGPGKQSLSRCPGHCCGRDNVTKTSPAPRPGPLSAPRTGQP